MFLAPYIGCVVSNLSPTDSGVENTTRSKARSTDACHLWEGIKTGVRDYVWTPRIKFHRGPGVKYHGWVVKPNKLISISQIRGNSRKEGNLPAHRGREHSEVERHVP